MITDVARAQLRAQVRGVYDIQKLRIQTGNRIVANFKVRLGQEPSKPEKDLEAEAKRVLNTIRADYRRLADGWSRFPGVKRFKPTELISSYTELCLIDQYVSLESSEGKHFRQIEGALGSFAIWTEFLKGETGVGPAMGGVIISEFDIHRAAYPSSLWKYAGLDVAGDGKGRSRRQEHLVEVDYTDKNGAAAKRKSITFNPFLKTKLMGVLAGSFLRTGAARRVDYDNYRHRLKSRPDFCDHEKGIDAHHDAAAKRYMVKMFLRDLYNTWRPLEGLDVAPTYQQAKLDPRPHHNGKAAA